MSKCIYAVLDYNKKSAIDLKGLDGTGIYSLPYKGISAAVSDMKRDRLKVDNETAAGYARIVEGLMEMHTVLPLRFGTLVKDDSEVAGVLEKYYERFVNNLKLVKGKLEYGLKALLDAEKTTALNEAEDRAGFEQLKGNSPYKKYLIEKLKEHKAGQALIKKADGIIEGVHRPLKELSFLSKFRKMATERIILDAVYLVEAEKKDIFIERFKEIKKKYRDVEFLFTGPWPPYNFIESSNIKKEQN